MKTHIHHVAIALLVAIIIAARASGADSSPLRLAVGPFFAPAGNERLQKVSALLPDLLTTELSHQDRFQLVEREKVSVIWDEMRLTADGLVSADTVSKLGHVLNCDWFVSGSFVTTESSTQVWTKVIDTRSGVVMDLQALPYNPTNLSATVSGIASFLTQVGLRPQEHQFIALGRFVDMSVSSMHEDWSRRLPALIEKHFHANGYGVVEREAVTPIFEEFQLEAVGLTGSISNRVKLRPAFWMVEGGCKWVRDTQDKLSVALRIRKIGYEAQVFRFTKLPGAESEKSVLEIIQAALADTNQIPVQQAAREEANVQMTLGMAAAMRGALLSASRYSRADAEGKTQLTNHKRATRDIFEKALLLDPNNLLAKRMRILTRLEDEEASERERGTNLLREMAASDNPILAEEARIYLTNSHPTLAHFEKALQFDPNDIMAKNNVAVSLLYNKDLSQRERATNLLSELAALNDAYFAPEARRYLTKALPISPTQWSTNDVAQAPTKIPTHWLHTDWFRDLTAISMEREGLLVATGTVLYRVKPWLNATERLNLPVELKNPITAIASDETALWLGTQGGGLVRVDKSSNASRIYDEKDGLLMSSISSLCLANNRLWIGFGFRQMGGFGYLDLQTDKFVGTVADVSIFKSLEELRKGPPDSRITAIKTADEKTLWVASSWVLHRYDIASQKWSLALPFGPVPACLTVGSNFAAVGMAQGGVTICKLPGEKWSTINLASDPGENRVVSLGVDYSDERLLWVGGQGRIRVIDRTTSKVVGVCNLVGLYDVLWILAEKDAVIFAAQGNTSGSCGVYWLERPSFLVERGGER